MIPGSGRSAGEGIGYPLQYSWASLVAQLVKNLPTLQEPGFSPWVRKIPWRTESLHTLVFWPGEFHGLYSPWGWKELDTTQGLSLSVYNFTLQRIQTYKKDWCLQISTYFHRQCYLQIDTCHLHLQRSNCELLQLLTFNTL